MFDEKSRRAASLIAFGVCLYAAVMHLDVVIGALSAVINIFFPVLLGLGFAFVLNVPVSGMERMLGRLVERLPEEKRPQPGLVTVVSIVLVLIAIAGVAVMAVTMLVPELIASARTVAPLLAERLPEIERALSAEGVDVDKLMAWLQPADGSASRSQGLQGLQGLMDFGLGSIATSVFAAARSTVSVVSSTVFAFVIAVYVLASKRVLGRQVNRMMDAHLAPRHATDRRLEGVRDLIGTESLVDHPQRVLDHDMLAERHVQAVDHANRLEAPLARGLRGDARALIRPGEAA